MTSAISRTDILAHLNQVHAALEGQVQDAHRGERLELLDVHVVLLAGPAHWHEDLLGIHGHVVQYLVEETVHQRDHCFVVHDLHASDFDVEIHKRFLHQRARTDLKWSHAGRKLEAFTPH